MIIMLSLRLGMLISLFRYAGRASGIEVSNEDDGLASFDPNPLPLNSTVSTLLLVFCITHRNCESESECG